MSWMNGMSSEEKGERYAAYCEEYQADRLGMKEFILALAKLGYNATDIEEAEKFYRPSPPENDNGETD